jgi:hypothetical protein
MNMTAGRKTSSDYSSFGTPPQPASRVKFALSPTISGDWKHPGGRHDGLENNSFVCSNLCGARFDRDAVEIRQTNCYEVRWTGLTTPPDDRRLT